MYSSTPSSTISPESDYSIIKTLQRLPSLSFSETGIKNLCKRFRVTESHLRQLISSAQKDKG